MIDLLSGYSWRRAAKVGVAVALMGLNGCKKREAQAAEPDHSEGAHAEAEGTSHDHEDHHEHAHEEGHDHDEEGHADEVHLTADAVVRYGVTLQAARRERLKPTFMAPARVTINTEAMAHVGSSLRGRAIEIKVRLGALVKAGEELLVIESPEFGEAQSEFLLKRIAARAAQPAVELTKAAWERGKTLHEQSGGIALAEVQKREGEYKAAAAALRADEGAAVAAENRLRLFGMEKAEIDALASSETIDPRFTIRAPIAGQVIERAVTIGELVGPERESLLIIADTSVLWVVADVPEARVPDLVIGAGVLIQVGSLNAPKYKGSIAFISPMIDAATRTATVRIEVQSEEAGGHALKPGMFAQTEIDANVSGVPVEMLVLAVPEQAVQVVEGGPAVFVEVAGESDTFAKRAVILGAAVGGLVIIESGLEEGERYVASGSFILKAELGKAGAEHVH